MFLALSKVKIITDERELSIQEKAARVTYAIFAPTLGLLSFLLLLPTRGGFSIFSRGEWSFIDSLGFIFAYLTLLLISLYALTYHFFKQKFGGKAEGTENEK